MDLVKDSKPLKLTRKQTAAEIVDMERRGMKLEEISAITGKSVSSVSQILKRAGVKHTALARFSADKASVWEDTERRLLLALEDEKIGKMSGKDLIIAAAVALDKGRLITGHSASGGNISLLVIANRVHQEYQSGKLLKGGDEHVIEAEVVSPPEPVAEDGDYV